MPSTSFAETLSLSTSTSTTAAATRVAQNSFQGLGAASHFALRSFFRSSAQSSGLESSPAEGGGAAYAQQAVSRPPRGPGNESVA
jgi:hypothetical protein